MLTLAKPYSQHRLTRPWTSLSVPETCSALSSIHRPYCRQSKREARAALAEVTAIATVAVAMAAERPLAASTYDPAYLSLQCPGPGLKKRWCRPTQVDCGIFLPISFWDFVINLARDSGGKSLPFRTKSPFNTLIGPSLLLHRLRVDQRRAKCILGLSCESCRFALCNW